MNSKTSTSLLNMCRTCMTQFSKAKKKDDIKNQSICEVPNGSKNDASIMEILQLIQPQIKVEIKDNLPTIMCSDCIKKLLMTQEFIEMYRNSDKIFRKMLKETDNVGSCENAVDTLNESLEIIVDKDNTGECFEKENNDDEFIITKYEIEIEEVNIEEMEKEEENENTWPEFEDEPLDEIPEVDEAIDREPLFVNPYSDASENEWMPNESCKNQISESAIAHTNNKDNSNSKKILTKRISKVRKNVKKEFELPVENEDGSILCQDCETVLENIEVWQEHMRHHRLEKRPKRKYLKKSNKPRKNASTQKNYKCEDCGKGFANSTSYKNHMRIHTGEEPYLCIECGKSFKVASSLNTHMLRHKGEKNIQCPHCPKKFVCSSGLYGHMMVHTKERPFVCDICGSAFHQAYQLRKHNLYHNGIKKYQCEYCDMRFVTGEKQRRHMRTHTGEKPYRCKYCERAFAQSNDCIKHLRQHLGDNVYQCELCPERFPLLRDLRLHFNTHKDDDEETRKSNLEARLEEERKLQIKLGFKET